jgi:acrylyl-CoA reductase (NADPH)
MEAPEEEAPMHDKFRALLATKDGDRQSIKLTELSDSDLMDGDVTVAVEYSTVNYKDGLAITGKAPIVRKFPLIPGIDLAGRVLRSQNPSFREGDRVVANGCGLGEVHHGGYSERARVKGDWLIRLPQNISTAQAMAIGTAGFTAMLCVIALEKEGVTPDSGSVLVTGAAGGVGSVAIALLDKLGYRVVASSRRAESEGDYLRALGADEIVDAKEFSGEPGRPLDKQRWGGAVDAVGSRTLANVLSQIQYGGAVAACGLAQGSDLPATVLPFILRDVTLAGVDSVMAPREKREVAWRRLATDLDLAKLDKMTRKAKLDDVASLAEQIVAGKSRGRVLIELRT